jgi:hypothetical protein
VNSKLSMRIGTSDTMCGCVCVGGWVSVLASSELTVSALTVQVRDAHFHSN